MNQRCLQLVNVLKRLLFNLNIFRSHFAPTADPYKIRTQIIATRVYLVLLAVTFFILVTYTSQVKVTHSVGIKYPTYEQFLRLDSIYSGTLSCPCSIISISYDQFIYLNASYHQICESVYTTSIWRQLIDSTTNNSEISLNFRYIGGPLFYALSSFCNLTSTTIRDGIIAFNATQLISGTSLSLDIFNANVENFIRAFISKTIRDFIRSREMIRDQTQYNGIMSGLGTNFYYKIDMVIQKNGSNYPIGEYFYSIPSAYVGQSSNCSCADTPFCTRPAFIDDKNSFHVPGMYFGCYIVESLLQSNLACFYNQSCINELRHALNSNVILNTTALDPTVPSQYASNDTIGYNVNQLMVEQWTNITSHRDYYDRCHVVMCTYSYVGKKRWFTVLTSIITPIGGLNIILKIIVPWVIMILRSRRRNNPGMPILLFTL